MFSGLALAGALALLSIAVARAPWAAGMGLSALTLAIGFGIVAGNTFFPALAPRAGLGVDYAKGQLLRLGIILYGFHITFQQIADVGWAGVVIDAAIVCCTFTLAVVLGTKVFKLDRETAMLIGAGSSICGAAAVIATEPVIKAQAHKVTVAVATVVLFGTISMFAYPLVYPLLGLTERAYGVFAGSTIHEVAQVVAAGRAVGEGAAATAVIVKMLRVMMLAPFLLILTGLQRRREAGQAGSKAAITIPWFALLFIVSSGINSLALLPEAAHAVILQVDTVLLAMAMAALGLRTNVTAIRQAGVKPLLLGLTLFTFLVGGGYGLNRLVMEILD